MHQIVRFCNRNFKNFPGALPPNPHAGEGLRRPSPDATPQRTGASRLDRGLWPLGRPSGNGEIKSWQPYLCIKLCEIWVVPLILLQWLKLAISNLVLQLAFGRVRRKITPTGKSGPGLGSFQKFGHTPLYFSSG